MGWELIVITSYQFLSYQQQLLRIAWHGGYKGQLVQSKVLIFTDGAVTPSLLSAGSNGA